jgi:dTDP-4-amino-4,6-dideoxygalactose transaminase
MLIPFLSLKKSNQKFETELLASFRKFLEKGQYILGENVKLFENNFAIYCDSIYCTGVANGLDALILTLQQFNFKNKAEIIVPANTYFASILAILKAGLKPILVEPNATDFLIDTQNLNNFITKNTVGILAVNLYGKMCDFETLNSICKNNNLKLIVDAAQSHGAIYKKSKSCLGAHATAYSFYPSKNLGAFADAGAVVTNDLELAQKLNCLRNYGSKIKYNFELEGINSRLSELQAGFLNIKLNYLEDEITKRRAIAAKYLNEIKNNDLILPPNSSIFEDSWHLFVVRSLNREKLLTHLTKYSIGYDIHYPIPPHKQKAMKAYNKLSLPITEKIHQQVVSLPMNSNLSNEEVNYIIDVLNKFRL